MKRADGGRNNEEVVDAGSRKCTFTVQIEAAVEAGAYQAPGFRYRFLDGSRQQTSTIGSGHGWTSAQDNGSAFPLLLSYRFEQSYPDIPISESFAMAVDDDPIMSFILFDHPVLAATGAVPRAQGNEIKTATFKAPSQPAAAHVTNSESHFTPRAFVEMFEMDVSSLLSGAQQIKQMWAKPRDGVEPHKSDDTKTEGLCCLNPSSGLQYFSVQVSVNQPLLTGNLLKKLNPLTITIGAGRRFPGAKNIGIEVASPHSPLQRYCQPAFATVNFYTDHLIYRSEKASDTTSRKHLSRLLITPGKRQAESIRWDTSLTLLCGRFNASELVDAIRYATLTVEIHDRDLKQEDLVSRLQLKWESLFTTGIDPANQLTENASSMPGASAVHSGLSAIPIAKPMELSRVDDIARNDWRMISASSGRLFPYGLATFRLVDLLNIAKQRIVRMPADNDGEPYVNLKLTTDVTAMKRRASPLDDITLSKSGELLTANDPFKKVVCEPGAYVTHGTSLSIYVKLQSPIETDAAEMQFRSENTSTDDDKSIDALLFSRMVVIIPYKDNITLGEVTKAMTTINLKALPGVSIRSYQMTEAEKNDCKNGILDVITGTQIIDSQFRMMIVEGLADKGMKHLAAQLHRKGPNDSQGFRLLCNNELRFARRLYTMFEIDLKRIKLRCPLSVIMTTPDIYVQVKVSESCRNALTRLIDMRKVERLVQAKHFDLFPTAQMLLDVESKHGEGITLEDIHGTKCENVIESSDCEVAIARKVVLSCENIKEGKHEIIKVKALTDSTNANYEQSRRNRVGRNFLLERKKHADFLQNKYAIQKHMAGKLQDNSQGPVYLYSGQKLRTQDLLQDNQRALLSKDRHATYTYSRNFQSLALSMVNPETLRQSNEREDRKKWTSQRGFIYPAPKSKSESNKHPKALSEARCEDLRQPFVDNVNNPKSVTRHLSEPGRQKRPEFFNLPSKDMIFGGINEDGTSNSNYFRSVHLCGEGLRLEKSEALRQEQEEWERRLVVDRTQLKFLAHGSICSQPRKKPSQLDKMEDILKGPAYSKPIQIVKNATLPSGKRVPLERPPVTILDQEKYVGCTADTFASTLRPFHCNQETTDSSSNKSQATTKVLALPIKNVVSRKKIMPVLDVEKSGLIWKNEGH